MTSATMDGVETKPKRAVARPPAPLLATGAIAIGIALVARRLLRGLHLPAHFGGRSMASGPKALHIVMEAKRGREDEVAELVASIGRDVEGEPNTRPWFGARRNASTFEIFETFPNEAARLRHLGGVGAARLLAKSNPLLVRPAQIDRLDVIAAKHE